MSDTAIPGSSFNWLKTLGLLFLSAYFAHGSWFPTELQAATYYVNNKSGSDEHDGLTAKTAVATIERAVQLSQTSDKIELCNTGQAYRESMVFRRLGGRPDKPLIVEGNGAVLSGLLPIDADQWELVQNNLYVLSLEKTPYGKPFLVSKGKRVSAARDEESLKAGEYYWDRDSSKIYLLCEPGKQPADYQLEATLRVSGFTLGSASYIQCRNLICEYFSNDGFNIHGDCRGIRLENVIARQNGDDGISIHETGGLVVQNACVHDNFYGIQDVNASRSVYNGVLVEKNQVGVSLVGGYHSLVDCQIRNNVQQEIDIAGSKPGHLLGAEQNLLCQTILFAQNVSILSGGSKTGLSIRSGAHAVMEHSSITGAKTGVFVDRLSHCHLTLTGIADCGTLLNLQSKHCFFDYNLYSPGQIQWLETIFQADQWSAYQSTSQLDQHSKVLNISVGPDGLIELPDRKAAFEKKTVGPTAPFTLAFPQGD